MGLGGFGIVLGEGGPDDGGDDAAALVARYGGFRFRALPFTSQPTYCSLSPGRIIVDILSGEQLGKSMPEDYNTFLNLRDHVMRELIDLIVTLARPSIICDIGSYNGEEALRFAALSPSSRVYAFEANRSNIEYFLQPNVTRAGLGNLRVENLAVSDTVGTTQFNVLESDGPDHIDWRRMAGSLLRRNDTMPYTTELVACTTLDFYFADCACDTFALWIDVEGALDRVLAGAHRVLSQTIIFRAEVERLQYWENQRLIGEVSAMAEELGFHFLADTYVEGGPGQSDALFLNRNWQELIRRQSG